HAPDVERRVERLARVLLAEVTCEAEFAEGVRNPDRDAREERQDAHEVVRDRRLLHASSSFVPGRSRSSWRSSVPVKRTARTTTMKSPTSRRAQRNESRTSWT